MLRINVRNEDLTMTRFALSPLWELIQALRLLPGGSRQPDEPVLRPWLLRARDRYRALAGGTDLGVIRALTPPGWGADFLAPVPASVHTTIGDLLDQVRSTPADQVQREVAAALARQPRVDPRIERILTSDRAAGYVADVLAAAWRALLEPEWRTLRAILERDVVYRAGQLASKGWAAALTDLHADLSWRQGQIELNRRPLGDGADDHADLGGRGLLFVPSVFIWPGLALSLDPPWPPALIYPARGSPRSGSSPAGPGRAPLCTGSSAPRAPRSCSRWRTRPAPRSWPRRWASLSAASGTTWPCSARPGWWPGPGPGARCCTGAPRSATRWPPPSSGQSDEQPELRAGR